jgi:hypothetical protein
MPQNALAFITGILYSYINTRPTPRSLKKTTNSYLIGLKDYFDSPTSLSSRHSTYYKIFKAFSLAYFSAPGCFFNARNVHFFFFVFLLSAEKTSVLYGVFAMPGRSLH